MTSTARFGCTALLGLLLLACSAVPSLEAARDQVETAERAFARSMAQRDLGAFAGFLAADAIFLSGDRALRGRAEVVEGWAGFFEGPTAPFAWAPEQVEVLASGDLALSTGPVYGADGALVARFTTIWRRETPGVWRVVFDRGCPVCATAASP